MKPKRSFGANHSSKDSTNGPSKWNENPSTPVPSMFHQTNPKSTPIYFAIVRILNFGNKENALGGGMLTSIQVAGSNLRR